MKIYRDIIQGSPEWFEVKLGKVSASHFKDVLNKKTGQGTYMYQLLGERLSGVPSESYSNKAIVAGIETEPQARAYYEALYGEVQQVGFVEVSDYLGCSPDGLIGIDGLVEVKCPFPSTHVRYILENKLPATYKAQVQGQLIVTERKWCDFVSFDPRVKDRPLWKIRVYRDEEYINMLASAIDDFVAELKELESRLTTKHNF